jgi:hypothetical protein
MLRMAPENPAGAIARSQCLWRELTAATLPARGSARRIAAVSLRQQRRAVVTFKLANVLGMQDLISWRCCQEGHGRHRGLQEQSTDQYRAGRAPISNLP